MNCSDATVAGKEITQKNVATGNKTSKQVWQVANITWALWMQLHLQWL